MKTWSKDAPNFIRLNWIPISLSFGVILLSLFAGGLAFRLTGYFSESEVLVIFGLLGFWLLFTLSMVKFDFMVFVGFCLLGMVRIEPAPVDVLLMLLLLVGFLTGKLSLKMLTGSSLIHLMLWLFLVINFASFMDAHEVSYSLRYFMITMYLIAFAYFVKMYVTSVQAMRNVFAGYLVSATVSTLMVVLGYLGVPSLEVFVTQGRALGFFKDPNVFGPFLIPVIILLIDEILYPRILPGLLPIKVTGIIVLVSCVFLSFSRAAWGNFVLSLFLYLVLNLKRLSLKRAVGLLLLFMVGFLALIILVNSLGLLEFLRWRASILQSYDSERFATQAEGIKAGLANLFGIGPGMMDGAHSLYVRSFAEYGILGFTSLVSCLFLLLIQTFLGALREKAKPYGLSAKVTAACFTGLLLNSFVIDTIHWRHFWLIFAFSWVVSTRKEPAAVPYYTAVNRRRLQ